MKKILILLFLLFLSSFLYASDFIETSDGAYLYLSHMSQMDMDYPYWKGVDFKGDNDGVIIRFGSNLKEKNKISIGGKSDDSLYSVCQCGNYYYVIGTAYKNSIGTGDFKGLKSKGVRDSILVKLDRNLKIVKCINFGTEGYNFPTEIVADKNGDIYVVGRIFSDVEEGAQQCAFIAKFSGDLKNKGFVKFRGSFSKPEDAYSTEFSSCIISDGKIVVCGSVGDGINSLGIVLQYNKDLKLVSKKSLKEKYFISLSSIKQNKNNYSICGYAMKDDYPIGYYTLLDSDFDVLFSKTFVSYTIEKPKYPAYCYLPKVLKDSYVWGYGGLYKGNGDYDDEMYHQFIYDFSAANHKYVLPDHTVSSCITEKNETVNVVFDGETDFYYLVKSKFK